MYGSLWSGSSTRASGSRPSARPRRAQRQRNRGDESGRDAGPDGGTVLLSRRQGVTLHRLIPILAVIFAIGLACVPLYRSRALLAAASRGDAATVASLL